MSRLTQERAEAALDFLANTDKEYGRLRGLVSGLDESRRIVKANEFLLNQGSAAMREQLAYASINYVEHIEKYESAVAEFETLRAQRLTAQTQIEMWRSVNSARKQGMVL